MASTRIKLKDVELRTYTIPLVRPFKFGMVELRELTHLRIAATFEVRVPGSERTLAVVGGAGENLVPKWFEKRADRSLEEDVRALRTAVNQVVQLALGMVGEVNPFRWWWRLYGEVAQAMPEVPGLVRQLGVSLLERAAIEAWCRAAGGTFHELLRSGSLGFEPEVVPGVVDESLRGEWRNALPARPVGTLAVRHTVGLGDDPAELRESLAASGIRRLKVKLSGTVDWDVERVRAVLAAQPEIDRVTLDGNENYADPAQLTAFGAALQHEPGLTAKVAWIEQALRRDVAMAQPVHEAPPQVIDESDDSVDALPRALRLGYAGTTHKACKGVFKSVLAAVRLTGRPGAILSAEDLTIVAPWSMAQDLAIAAAVAVLDVERNGHHYADGLTAFDSEVSREAVRAHPDLYELDPRGIASLKIRNGMLRFEQVNASPLGWAGVSASARGL